MKSFHYRFTTGILFTCIAVFSGEAEAATVSCTRDAICSPPYTSCTGTNCGTICNSPSSYGYSAYGGPNTWYDSTTMVCTQKYWNSVNPTVTSSAGTGGTITPTGSQTITQGEATSFMATANAGYNFTNFTTNCPGGPTGNSYFTGAIENNCSIAANFTPAYTVSTSLGPNGSISPTSRSVNIDSYTTFTITPSAGYAVLSATGCGGTLAGNTYQTSAFNMDCTINVTFGFRVSTSVPAGGKITPTSTVVAPSGSTSFTVTALNGYSLSGVTGCGGSLSGNTYTTGAISAACTVSATVTGEAAGTVTCNRSGSTDTCVDYFVGCTGTDCTDYCQNPSSYGLTRTSHTSNYDFDYEEYYCTDVWTGAAANYTVTPSVYGGGTISPDTAQSVSPGGTKAFTLTPNTGYAIYNVTGTCGGTLSGSTFTTNAVNANCTVIGNFAAGTDGYRLNSGQEIMINAHTVCKKITNNNASAIFIPTKSATEWLQFRTNATGISQANCP